MTLPAIALLLLAALVLGCSGNPPLAPSTAPSASAAGGAATPSASEPAPSDAPTPSASDAPGAVRIGDR